MHVDIILRIFLIFIDGSQKPWGMLRLPASEVLSRGTHQGWFFLSHNITGNPFRKHVHTLYPCHEDLVVESLNLTFSFFLVLGNHNGDHAGVHLCIEVQESEVERLKVELLQAQEEIEYLKQHQNFEIHEALEQALRNNRLLEKMIGDMRDELQSAKYALISHGVVQQQRLFCSAIMLLSL